MATPLSLFIGSIEIPQTVLTISQTYAKLSAMTDTRMADGALFRRTHWSGKLASQINIKGVSASALDEVDFSTSHIIKCIAPLGVSSVGNDRIFNIPANRRSDTGAEPYAMGYFSSSNQWVTASSSVAGNEITITDIGADIYKAFYYPEFTAFFQYPQESASEGVISSWSISCEEI